MLNTNCLIPNINDGRFFVSPILGCTGACGYCYLKIKNFSLPRKNELTTTDFLSIARQSPDFVWGQNGTIISVGAWGDIFPLNKTELIQHSVQVIRYLLSWGNPVQIMSKNCLNKSFVKELVGAVRYPGQLLYSTTITTVNAWRKIETGTSSPTERLLTCRSFHESGVPTNVLLKPFILNLTDLEIEAISNALIEYQIDYCTLGVMYWSPEISLQISKNPFLRELVGNDTFSLSNHLDCNGDTSVFSTPIDTLLPYVKFLREKGIATFLKSSCVSSNILHTFNLSDYYNQKNPYCINCGICKCHKE